VAKGGRLQALDTALKSIRKRFGEGAVMKLDQATHLDVKAIPTGALSLDIALGIGGVPAGASPRSMARRGRAKRRCASTSSPKRSR
jgi:RecA/RadA recombinase